VIGARVTVGVVGLLGIAVMAMILVVPPASEAGAKSKRVACFKSAFPAPGEGPALRKKPKKCIYIDKRGLSNQVPPAHTTRTTQGVRWTKWGGRLARGRGKAFVADRTQPVPVRITLSRPVKRCGKRVYSRAKFRFTFQGTTLGPFRLVTC
jgi:hypothetical protein